MPITKSARKSFIRYQYFGCRAQWEHKKWPNGTSKMAKWNIINGPIEHQNGPMGNQNDPMEY